MFASKIVTFQSGRKLSRYRLLITGFALVVRWEHSLWTCNKTREEKLRFTDKNPENCYMSISTFLSILHRVFWWIKTFDLYKFHCGENVKNQVCKSYIYVVMFQCICRRFPVLSFTRHCRPKFRRPRSSPQWASRPFIMGKLEPHQGKKADRGRGSRRILRGWLQG